MSNILKWPQSKIELERLHDDVLHYSDGSIYFFRCASSHIAQDELSTHACGYYLTLSAKVDGLWLGLHVGRANKL